jgi:hypothetical protein
LPFLFFISFEVDLYVIQSKKHDLVLFSEARIMLYECISHNFCYSDKIPREILNREQIYFDSCFQWVQSMVAWLLPLHRTSWWQEQVVEEVLYLMEPHRQIGTWDKLELPSPLRDIPPVTYFLQ